MNVLSLFDGIACGRHALERCGIPVTSYYASEVDKYAIQIARKNYPDIIHVGDVRNIRITGKIKFDLLIGGSPCKGFSVAGKGLNFEDPRSKLFFEYVRILNDLRKVNPSILFLLENVRMKKEWQDRISELLGVEPIYRDSKFFSAHSRKRLYWTNLPVDECPSLEHPNLLKDILTTPGTGVVRKGNEWSMRNEKSLCLDAHYYKGIDSHQARMAIFLTKEEIDKAIESFGYKIHKSGNTRGNMKFPDSINRKSRCLVGMTIKGNRNTIHIQEGDGIRLLNVTECERLQGLPDYYCDGVSDMQAYKALGNGWQIDTIMHIFEAMKKAPTHP